MDAVDYLIIGQGLAGSLLAWHLMQRHKRVLVVDNGLHNASQVAAGLINPVTGMRFVKSSHVDQLLPAAKSLYQQLSQHFNHAFYIEKPMLRLLRNNKELLACQKRLNQAEYQAYLTKIIPSHALFNAANGLLEQSHTGFLLTQPLLAHLKDYFIQHNAYIKADIIYDDINFKPALQWNNIVAKQIIFCEGYKATHNPWFSYLPFQPVKGEIISATANHTLQPTLLNYGHWFIPLNDKQFRTGATFEREDFSLQPSVTAKDTLFNALKHVYPSLTVKDISSQQVGIRPTTLDKQPFLGQHPKQSNLFIFNGFGAKGSLQIPFYCQHFADHLIHQHPLMSSSHILRYHSLWTH